MLDRSKVARLAFSLAIVSGLLFGGYQALQGTAVQTCTWDPPTELGSCVNEAECDYKCSLWWPEYLPVCQNGCCTCIGG